MPADRSVDLLPAHALLEVWVVGDRLEHDVLDPLVPTPLTDIVTDLRGGQRHRRQLRFLHPPWDRVTQQVVREASPHQALPGQGERHPRGIDGDPTPTPLLCDVGRGARATCGVEHKITW